MANRSCGRSQQSSPAAAGQNGTPAFPEPEVRRWPHPVHGAEPPCQSTPQQTDTALRYIHCALSYQNQLLADIKAILEKLPADAVQPLEEK